MDFSTAIQNVNWMAVLVAALSMFIIEGVWYSIFEKNWMESNNFSREDLQKRNMPVIFGLSFILSFIMAFDMALSIGHNGVKYGITAGFLVGLLVAMGLAVVSLFEKRPLKYILVNGGYLITVFTTMGIIIGTWK